MTEYEKFMNEKFEGIAWRFANEDELPIETPIEMVFNDDGPLMLVDKRKFDSFVTGIKVSSK